MSQPTLSGDRRARCHICGVVLHTIGGTVRHYGSDAACKRIQELQLEVSDLRSTLRKAKSIVGASSASVGPGELRDIRVRVYQEIERALAAKLEDRADGETKAPA